MTTQLTATEIQNISQLLQDYAPAQKTLTILNETNGDLEKSFEELWTEQHGKQDFDKIKLWQSTVTVFRQELCGKEGFQNQVKEYNKNPSSTPLLTGLIVSVVHSVGFPIDPAIATVVVLYILKVGINIFCDYINPEETKK
ncbi:MAG: hypothetical protein DCE90_04685 [Pseudanabaena sp.]|nr:MAG: hypothetical protein DCE90_04685 [Pseudanabaena sp.]